MQLSDETAEGILMIVLVPLAVTGGEGMMGVGGELGVPTTAIEVDDGEFVPELSPP